MIALIDTFWKICRLRLGPQELPASNTLLAFCLVIYWVVNTATTAIVLSLVTALLSAVVDVVLLVIMTQVVLWVRELGARFVQTATALAGTGIIISLFMMPLFYIAQQKPEAGAVLLALATLGLMSWNLIIVGHIMRHALNIPFFGGLVVALLYMFVYMGIIDFLFETPTAG